MKNYQLTILYVGLTLILYQLFNFDFQTAENVEKEVIFIFL